MKADKKRAGSAHPAALSPGTLRPDLIAGLTAAAVVLPKAMAYATVAGLPVSVGLYTAFVPLVVYALLGTSRVLSVSSTTTLAILTGTELGMAVPDGDPVKLVLATATLTVLTGAILVAASLLRFGFVANFISSPVLTGFKAGIGVVIVFDQVPKLLGLHIDKEGFFRDLLSLLRHLPETSVLTLAVGGTALAALFLLERRWPHSPAPLVAVGAAIAVSGIAGLGSLGVAIVGHIPQALPSLTLPDMSYATMLLPGALGIALMSFTETIAAGRAFAAPNDPPIRADRELLATGAANVAGGLFGAMPAGGGTSQTAVTRAVGGRTQKASLVTAAASVATMLLLAPLLGLLPQSVLAAIVIVYSMGLVRPVEFAAIYRVRRMEYLWAVAAFLGVLVFGTLQGIVVAIVLSLVSLARQVASPAVHVVGRKRGTDILRPLSPEHPDDETFPGLLILRPEGRLFFVNIQHVAEQIRSAIATYAPEIVVLDLSRVFDIEYSAFQLLQEGRDRLDRQGAQLWLAGLNPTVLDYIRASGMADELGPDRLHYSAQTALAAYLAARAEGQVAGPSG